MIRETLRDVSVREYMSQWTKRIVLSVIILMVCGSGLHAQSNAPIQYGYDDLGRLIKVVDQSGNAATYTYDAVGNIVRITRSTVPGSGLAILSFVPQSGFTGQAITIQGQGFSATPGANVVRFNGTIASVNTATSTTLTVTVPAGATTGPISLAVGGSTANSDTNFTVVPPALVSLAVAPPDAAILRVTQQFRATGTFQDGSTRDLTNSVTWSSSNSSVATISNTSGSQGLATAMTAGNTVIVATSGPIIGTSRVRVVALTSLEIFPANRTIARGTTQQFTAFGNLSDGTGQNFTNLVTWTSSNAVVAAIGTPAGERVFATGISDGHTTITATFGSVSASTTLTVGAGTSTVFPRFSFVLNTDGTIALGSVYPNTGQLRSNGSTSYGVTGGTAIALDPASKFAYVANGSPSNTVSAFTIGVDGTLTAVAGSPFATGTNPVALTVDPLGRFLYVTNRNADSISAYSINATTGALTPTPNSPFVGGGGGGPNPENPVAVAVDPAGKFAFVAESGRAKIAVYTINQQTGDLVELSASPFATGNLPFGIVVNPAGTIVYVVNEGDSTVSAFTIDQTTGMLTQVSGSPFGVGGSLPNSIAMDPAGKFVYTSNSSSQSVSALAVNATNGTLTPVNGSPFGAGLLPGPVVVDPSGSYAYVVNGDSTIIAYGIDPVTGALTNLGGVPHRAPSSIAITKGNAAVAYTPQFAYVANAGPPAGSNNLSGYSINSTSGALTALTGSPFTEGFSPQSNLAILLAPFLYVTNLCSDLSCSSLNGSVSAFTVDATAGALATVQGSPFLAGRGPRGVAVDPSGRFAYAVNSTDNTVSAYAITAGTGALSAIIGSPFTTGTGPQAVAVDSTGLFLYVVNSCAGSPCTNGSVSAFTISQSTGALTSAGTFAVGNAPQSLSIDPTGRFVYVLNKSDSTVSAFAIDRTSGALNAVPLSPFATGQGPAAVALDPTGKFAYVTNSVAGDVSAYVIDSTSGTLTAIQGSPFTAGTKPVSVSVDVSGKFLYVANQNGNTVSAFSIDPASGALIAAPGSPFGTGTSPVSVTTTGKVR
jgi:6-phosphogluconolactonase